MSLGDMSEDDIRTAVKKLGLDSRCSTAGSFSPEEIAQISELFQCAQQGYEEHRIDNQRGTPYEHVCKELAAEMAKLGNAEGAEWLIDRAESNIQNDAVNVLGMIDLTKLPIPLLRRLASLKSRWCYGGVEEERDCLSVQKNAARALKQWKS